MEDSVSKLLKPAENHRPQQIQQIDFLREDGSTDTLTANDVVLMSNGDIGAVTNMYDNGTFLFYDMGTSVNVRDVYQIRKNLSIVSKEEDEVMQRQYQWRTGTQVEVLSRSSDEWCTGEITGVLELKSKSPLVAHTTTWFQLKYFNLDKETFQFKQLPWNSRDIRSPAEDSVHTSSSSTSQSLVSESSHQI